MKGKEFIVRPKSKIKRDKAIKEEQRLLELLNELKEKKLSIKKLEETANKKLRNVRKTIRSNS